MAVIERSDVLRRHIVGCELCSAKASVEAADSAGWDWFTGTLRRTMHYCPAHKKSPERDRAFEKSRQVPVAKGRP